MRVDNPEESSNIFWEYRRRDQYRLDNTSGKFVIWDQSLSNTHEMDFAIFESLKLRNFKTSQIFDFETGSFETWKL